MVKKENIKQIFFDVAKNKKVQIGLTVIIFLIILFTSTSLRLSNLPLLVDRTTGEYNLADPDAYYMYRVAQTYLERDGDLSGIDPMRGPGLNLTYNKEILSPVLVYSYKFLKVFNSDLTLNVVDVYYPAIAFSFSLIIFFFLVFYISRSKSASLLASALLAYFPSYLGRTTAGISSHESLGMVFMFLTLWAFVFSLDKLQNSWKRVGIGGVLVGITLALSFVSWGGGSNFALMTFPIASLLYYLFKITDNNLEDKKRFIAFTALWVLVAVLITPLFGYNLDAFAGRLASSYGILIPFTILFMIVDFLLESFSAKINFARSKYRIGYSLLGTIIIGLAGLAMVGKNPFSLIYSIYYQLLYPFGTSRVGLTVAYYAQPYMADLIAQYTPLIFWMAFAGMIFIGLDISKKIKSLKHKWYFIFAWAIAISGMIFSRMSATSIFNGTNAISQIVYLTCLGIFAIYLLWTYFNAHFEMDSRNVFLFAWMIVMILSMRSAVRVISVILVFILVSAILFILKAYEYGRSAKDQTLKYILYTISLVSLILMIIFLFGNPITKTAGVYKIAGYSAANMGPITDEQWQYAMEWVRNNTDESSIFIHWWDYGYLVQTLGGRATILDGGNANAYWDHLFARYVLTTPFPATALSYLKAHKVSYLLIDPTDLGKYGAYSKIGGDNNWDRFSAPSAIVSDPKQTKETANGTVRIYGGTTFVDEDISYGKTFLPGPTYDKIGNPSYKSYFLGIISETNQVKNSSMVQINQPNAVFVYNNNQISLPVRYVYYEGRVTDFGTGINSTFVIFPQVTQTTNGQIQIDSLGAGIYLSERVSKGLYAQLYLMGDPNRLYSTITLAHTEDDPVVKQLKKQGADLGEFVYFQGLRSPLKIWKVEYPSNTLAREEFRAVDGEYAEFDNLIFTA